MLLDANCWHLGELGRAYLHACWSCDGIKGCGACMVALVLACMYCSFTLMCIFLTAFLLHCCPQVLLHRPRHQARLPGHQPHSHPEGILPQAGCQEVMYLRQIWNRHESRSPLNKWRMDGWTDGLVCHRSRMGGGGAGGSAAVGVRNVARCLVTCAGAVQLP